MPKEHILEVLLSKIPSEIIASKSPIPTLKITDIQPPEHGHSTSLVFVSTEEQLIEAMRHQPCTIVYSNKLTPLVQKDFLNTSKAKDSFLFAVNNVTLAMSAILPAFDNKKDRFNWGQSDLIHSTAIVDPSAHIGPGTRIGPYSVIGKNVKISSDCLIGAHVVIEMNASIGQNTILHSTVFIGANTQIGQNCEIHPHTTLGSDGYGYAQDTKRKNYKIPQLGKIVVGDNVEIGSGCAIDRAAFTETRIESGVKIDNLCHIAHNVVIGEDSLCTAGLMVAGSSQIGKRFMCGGMVAITDHVKVADDVTLAGRSTVTNDITTAGAYGGYPLTPMKDHLKNLASYTHITSMRKSIQKILKHLGIEGE